jgi:C4-type Zn-finger protein
MTQKCPVCGSDVDSAPNKTWFFAQYLVERYTCNECNNVFNVYYKEKKEVYTIPKRKGQTCN